MSSDLPAHGTPPHPLADGEFRYAAFISYRHAEPDRRWAKWLHSALESYRVAPRLVRERGAGARISRVFRDEEELPASSDLSQIITEALAGSRHLIVVCSPRARESRWINEEVARFREMGRGDRILALLIEGNPAEAFPQALVEIRRKTTDGTSPVIDQVELVEPLAADVRPSRVDGRRYLRRMALLRLAAAILGVPFDDLRRRDQEIRSRRLARLAGVSFGVLALMMGLTIFAFHQRSRAIEQRGEAVKQRANADARRVDAENSAREARRRLASLYASRGWATFDAGDPSTALLYFAHSLDSLRDDPSDEQVARVRFGCAMDFAPALLRVMDDTPEAARREHWAVATAGELHALQLVWRGPTDPHTLAIWDPLRPDSLTPIHLDASMRRFRQSADSRRAIIATDGGYAEVWDLVNVRRVSPPLNHAALRSASLNADGTRAVTANDRTAIIWNCDTGKPVGAPLQHDETIDDAIFAGSRRIVTSCSDSYARVWNSETGELVGQPVKTVDSSPLLVLSPDGQTVAAFNLGPVLRIIAVSNASTVAAIRHDAQVTAATFSPDGRTIATFCNRVGARLWDSQNGTPRTPLLPHPASNGHVVFGAGGSRVVTLGDDRVARVWSVPDGKLLTPPLAHPNMIVAAAFTPDNNQLFIGCNFRASSVWDLTSARPPRLTLPHRGVTSAQFSPDGTRVVTTGSDNYARIWDANTGQSIGAAMGHDKSVTDARWSPDGHRIVTASEDRTARIWDAATGLPITPAMKQATIIGRVIFSPDGKQVATGATAASYDSEQHGSEAMLWDAATGKPLSLPLRATERIVGLQFTLAGPRAILTSSTNDSARVYDIRTGAVVGGPFPTDQFPLAGVLSRDGARVIIGSADGSLRIWNVATGKLLREPLPHGDTGTSPIFDLALDANDTRVVSAGGDGTARVWNTNTGKSVAQWLKHRGIIVSAAFSPDGARVVTASIDGTARVWDSATGQPLSPPLLHPVAIGASFSPDGTHVLSIGSGKAIIWAIGQSALTPADALSFSELISGQTLDDGDGLRPLTRDEWLERGRELKHYRPLPASHPASMLVPTAR